MPYISHAKDRDKKYLTREVDDFYRLQEEWNMLTERYFSTSSKEEKNIYMEKMRDIRTSTGRTLYYKSEHSTPQEVYARTMELESLLSGDHTVEQEFYVQYKDEMAKYHALLTNVLDVAEVLDEFESIHNFVKCKAEILGLFQDDIVEFDVEFDKQLYKYAEEQVFMGKVRILSKRFQRCFTILGVLASREKTEYLIKKIYSIHKLAER